MLLHRQVDGAIVFDSKVSDAAVEKLASRRFPIVVLDRLIEDEYISSILLDNVQGVREAFAHLIGQGFRRMAFVAGARDSFDNAERMAAFLSEAQAHDVSVTVHAGDFSEISGYNAARALIMAGDLPEAVFCANDQMALGFLRAAHEAGLRVPEQIALVGFDDIPLTRYTQPTISTIGTSRHEWGATAVRQLLDLLEKDIPFQPRRIPTRLIARQSSMRCVSGSSQQHFLIHIHCAVHRTT
jgi:LacI family transcriptional regulator